MREHFACHAVFGVNPLEMVHLKGFLAGGRPRNGQKVYTKFLLSVNDCHHWTNTMSASTR